MVIATRWQGEDDRRRHNGGLLQRQCHEGRDAVAQRHAGPIYARLAGLHPHRGRDIQMTNKLFLAFRKLVDDVRDTSSGEKNKPSASDRVEARISSFGFV
jgi:hypothetical protein